MALLRAGDSLRSQLGLVKEMRGDLILKSAQRKCPALIGVFLWAEAERVQERRVSEREEVVCRLNEIHRFQTGDVLSGAHKFQLVSKPQSRYRHIS